MRGYKKIVYDFLIYPVVVALAHFLALVNKNIRQAVKGRYRAAKALKSFKADARPTVYFHAASLGEFEHIRPLIFYLGKTHRIVVTFFSPSGFNHAKKQFPDEMHFYLPFDFYRLWLRILNALRPKWIFISKHDIWANQIMAAHRLHIPVYLVNASLSAESSRLNGLYRFFYSPIYRQITKIFAISKDDKQRMEQAFKVRNVSVVGDTKFDQVVIRKEQARGKQLIAREWLGNSLVVVLGSIWPEDYAVLAGPLRRLMQECETLKLFFVPHQPHETFLKQIETDFSPFGTGRYTLKDELSTERCLIVDVVGILADLYKYGHLAYVGGSFKQGIHNVMEAAVYGIPVFFGPKHENSYEATQLVKKKAAFVVRNESEAFHILKRLIEDEPFRKEAGRHVQHFVEKHTGATARILRELGV